VPVTRSIVLGGLVGIAIGALITFAIAHGVFELSTARAELRAPSSSSVPFRDDGEHDIATQVTHRPLRPGSTPRGTRCASHAQQT
jgi:hypothetical protein